MTNSPHAPQGHVQHYWLWVMCLTGVDYFSTLGYQPSVAFEATGRLAPLATILLVILTIFGALPVYGFVAGRSPHGQGSIAMLEKLVSGWTGKILVLALLGFAATDFVITKTLSAADATEHLISNPYWHKLDEAIARVLGMDPEVFRAPGVEAKQRIFVTMFLLLMLGAMFMRGFREVIGLAVCLVAVYLVLNALIIGSCIQYLLAHPEKLQTWFDQVRQGDWHLQEKPLEGTDWLTIALLSFWFFPKLALGLSGFETGVAVMPLIQGKAGDDPARPKARIANTRKLLVVAALIMSIGLMGAAISITTLIPAEDITGPLGKVTEEKPPAKDRALAYLAHGQAPDKDISPLFGNAFGTIYDISTIVILWFAGASAMAGLLNLVPQYLPRYGMAPEWAAAVRPLVLLFTAINLFVTVWFDASVTSQSGAYATGVLVLMSSACVATVIERWRQGRGFWLFRMPWYFVLISLVFFYTTAANIIEKPDGIKIASCFIAGIIAASVISRTMRSTELRFAGFQFKDEQSKFLWTSMQALEFPVLVPHRPGGRDLLQKEESIRRDHRLPAEVPVVFIEAELGDSSDFFQEPLLEVTQDQERFIIRVTRCASIAHVLAALGLELSKVGKPPEFHFGWSEESPLRVNLDFLLFGEGNVPWHVRELLKKSEARPERRPRVIIG